MKKEEKNAKDKNMQALVYFPIIGGLTYLFLDNAKNEMKIHAAQSIIMDIVMLVFCLIPYLRYIVLLVYISFKILGVLKIVKNLDPKIPYVYEIYEKIRDKIDK